MSLLVTCPHPGCGKTSSVAEEHSGQKCFCPHCKQLFMPGQSANPPLAEAIQPAYPKPAPRGPGSALPPTIGRFQIRARVGAGAFGTVYAYDPQLDREVALKVPLPGTLDDPQQVERFLREARAAAQLRHPHIVPLFEAGGQPPDYYLASAFIEGRTLGAALKEGAFDGREAARVVRDLAEALAYAHRQGIVHRDVKPDNVLLDGDGEPHLLDFGLAQRRDTAERLTQDGALVGTPAYMAPEQVTAQRAEATPASDQFSLGTLLYELLVGRTPFDGPPEVVLFNVLHVEPAPPRRVNAKVPRDLETICQKAMARRPAERYPSCQDLADDLRRWVEGEPIRARRLGPLERAGRWCRRNPLVAGLATAVALSLLLGTTVAWKKAAEAEANAERADQQAAEAKANAKRADQKAAEAEANAERVSEAKRTLDRHLYVSNMNLAQRTWEEGKMTRLLELLEGQRPQATEGVELRGFEWHYWWRCSHTELLTLKGHTSSVTCVCFSPDGKRLASSSWDGTVKVWDAQTSKETLSFKAHNSRASSVCFSPDGNRLASAEWGSQDGQGKPLPGEVKVWDAQTGQAALSLKGLTGGVLAAAFSPDGKRLASSSGDGTVTVWDAQTGKETLSFHTSNVLSVCFSPNGQRLASSGVREQDGQGKPVTDEIKIWDAQTGQEVFCFKVDSGRVTRLAFSPDGKRLAGVSRNAFNSFEVNIWDAQNGHKALSLNGHTAWVSSVCFSSDGLRLATASLDQAVKVWDAQTGQETLSLKGHTNGVNCVSFSPDGKRLVSASADGTIKVWDAQNSKESPTVSGLGNPVRSVCFSPDGKRLASACFNGPVRVCDSQTGQEILTLKGNTLWMHCVCFSPDGRYVTSTCQNGPGNVWDAQTGQELFTFKGSGVPLRGACFSPNGQRLASASMEGMVKLFDVETGRETLSLKGHPHRIVSSLCFSPDSKSLASASNDSTLKMWDAQTGQEIRTLTGHTAWVFSVCFSPDGRRLASASHDQTVKVWDAQTGQELRTLRGHTRDVNSVCFSPDGQRLASASFDGTVILWDAQTGQEILTLNGSGSALSGVCFSPDGQRLASGNGDGTVKVWDAKPLREDLSP